MRYSIFFLLFAFLFTCGCNNSSDTTNQLSGPDAEKALMQMLITAKSGDKIMLPEGTFNFKRPLSLNDVSNVTIQGKGKGKTVLSFKDQIEGAEGLIIKKVKGITLEGFSVQDSKGDAIKVQDSENVTMRDLEATWTGGALSTNGGYGLYPVNCTNVLMEKCEASYASDAGIYVGQSRNAIIRDNYAHHNVAGIEIENTRKADVYNNNSTGNTGGILVFDMPDLPQANGFQIKVHDNKCIDNNHPNFAPKGTAVAMVPPGSGITIMAHKEIEIYNNTIKGHNTASIGINSWLLTGIPYKSETFNPFYSSINIYDNKIEAGTGTSDTSTDFGKLISAVSGGKSVDIIMDGILNPELIDGKGMLQGKDKICFRNMGEVSFINLNAGLGATPEAMAKNMTTDISVFNCELETLQMSELENWLALN